MLFLRGLSLLFAPLLLLIIGAFLQARESKRERESLVEVAILSPSLSLKKTISSIPPLSPSTRWETSVGITPLAVREDDESLPSSDRPFLLLTLNQFLRSLRQADFRQSYTLYTSRYFRQKTSYQEFQQFVLRYPSLSHQMSATFEEPTFMEVYAEINAIFVASNDSKNLIHFDLIFEEGSWKILGMKIYPYQEPARA